MTYFVIHGTEDGDIRISSLTKEELEDRLNDKHWGSDPKIWNRVPDFESTSGLLIIKGEIVVPRSVKVVEKVELP